MRLSAVLAAAMAAALSCASSAMAADVQLAYFTPGNITRSGLQNTHTIALTFDDGPNSNTKGVLAALRKYHIQATFFVVGDMARTHMSILRQIVAEGHLLANHTGSHPRLGARFVRHKASLISQLRQVHDLIAPIMQPGEPFFFRAPYGYWRKSHAATLNADPILKYYAGPLYWDAGGDTYVNEDGYVVRSADWDCWPRGWSAETCAKGYLREITAKDGGVVLMHCIHAQSAALVEAVVPTLQDKGFTFVRLDQVPVYMRYEGPPPVPKPAVPAAVAMAGARPAHGR